MSPILQEEECHLQIEEKISQKQVDDRYLVLLDQVEYSIQENLRKSLLLHYQMKFVCEFLISITRTAIRAFRSCFVLSALLQSLSCAGSAP
jgi:pantothenate kinase